MSERASTTLRRRQPTGTAETLAIVLGDQLDHDSSIFDRIDPKRDVILMMEVREESEHVPSHRQRTTLFLSAMRHFALEQIERGYRVRYSTLDDESNTQDFTGEVTRAVQDLKPERIVLVEPGEQRVMTMVRSWRRSLKNITIDVLEDTHFLCTHEEFSKWAEGRKNLVLEYFYREMRRRLNVLMTEDGKPRGGTWNYDKENRQTFKSAPRPPAPRRFRPDAVTREVMEMVNAQFPDAYGSLDSFGWPVTRKEALAALDDFLENRFARFGPYQDAMWTDQPFLYHSIISPAINLKLLNPREVVDRALNAASEYGVPLQSLEGFIRQIIGWREFIRGVYWREGRDYGKRNELDQHGSLPEFYWTGETDMQCMKHALGQVIEHGYGHHIQRLMVTGNFALISGISPRAISDWYLAMYVDAVDWVTLPNTLGMIMHADGGVVGSKPYAASGRYIQRMSNYCKECRYNPAKRTGDDACPFTTFYWDFLIRNRNRFESNQRMAMIMKNVERMSNDERVEITVSAKEQRKAFGI
ncbi:MAG: cryptochrome/photolyase family protein [Phycisphaerales bacterium]|nr:MAG: cryptochrome/photolyase family protein [Phycisphaerales bacterium]